MAKRKVIRTRPIRKKKKTWHGPEVVFVRGRKPDPCEREHTDCAEC